MIRHYHKRAYQRANINKKYSADKFQANAHKHGKPINFFRNIDTPLAQEFTQFLDKKAATGKVIKVYRQWIFVFNSSNNKATTMYPIPEQFKPLITSGWNTRVVFKFFHPINEELTQLIHHEDVDFKHIRSIFAHLLQDNQSLSDKGPFCVKQNGQIEKDFVCVGLWRVVKR